MKYNMKAIFKGCNDNYREINRFYNSVFTIGNKYYFIKESEKHKYYEVVCNFNYNCYVSDLHLSLYFEPVNERRKRIINDI